MSDTQVFVALAIALIPGLLALRLSTELYKQLIYLTPSMVIWAVVDRTTAHFYGDFRYNVVVWQFL